MIRRPALRRLTPVRSLPHSSIVRIVVAAAIALGAGCGDRGHGDDDVVLALPSSNLVFTTAFVAEDLGLFHEEGLRVNVRNVVGVGSVNAVIGGSADFTLGSGTTLLHAVSQGQRLLAIANFVDRPMVELVLRRDAADRVGITKDMSLAERGRRLKGLTLGIQGVGSIVHAWARFVVIAGGLDAERDVRITPMDPPAMAAAMKHRLIDGYASSPPFTTEAVLGGEAVTLASGVTDAPDLVPFAYLVLYAKPDTCALRADVCRRLVRAFASASRMVHDYPDAVFDQVLRRRYPNMDEHLLRAAWNITRQAHAAGAAVDQRQLANSQKVSVLAGLLEPGQIIARFDDLYINDFDR
jgi:NitT/TauT family transport system substrate-binding protein